MDDETHTHTDRADGKPGPKTRAQLLLKELPGALTLAVLTAVVTLILAVVITAVTGEENVRHREATRCQTAHITDLILSIVEARGIEVEDHRRINVDGIDCTPYLTDPFQEDFD